MPASRHRPASLADLVEADDETRFFWEGVAAQRLLFLRCDACSRFQHPPRPVCRSCLSEALSPTAVSGRGVVYSYTTTMRPFHPYFVDKVPYVVATITLEEQPDLQFVSNLVDCTETQIRIGMPVRVSFRESWPGVQLPLFVPSAAGEAS